VSVVVLAGGTGGARLARGMLDVVGPQNLVVVANTGDDVEIYGAHVSPDPDLVAFWLADLIDERGWGLEGDTFMVMDGLRALGVEVWFNLGDRDLALGIERLRRLREGQGLVAAHAELMDRLGVPGRVLAMSEDPVRTHVRAAGRWWPLQEFLIGRRGEGPIEGVRFDGADHARPAAEVLEAIGDAEAIVIGPSNPIISIGPILALPGMREALAGAGAPVVAVSPVVGGEIVKGPTAACMQWAGQECSAQGVAAVYEGVIDGIVADEPVQGLPVLQTGTLMSDAASRRMLADETLAFARALASR
jgi:LPPG:FO 2-phospho-L-lactate transferase